MDINCDRCGKQLEEMGALLFSPPEDSGRGSMITVKNHLCTQCYFDIVNELRTHKEKFKKDLQNP